MELHQLKIRNGKLELNRPEKKVALFGWGNPLSVPEIPHIVMTRAEANARGIHKPSYTIINGLRVPIYIQD